MPPSEVISASSSSPRQARRRARNRAALVQAARTVFTRDGFEGATIAAIAEAADLGFGTFYRYFPDKEAVLAAVVDEVRQELGDVLRSAETAGGPASDALRGFTARLVGALVRNRDLLRLFWQMALRSGRTDPAAREFPGLVGAAVRRIVARGVDSGEFAAGDPELIAGFITSMHLFLLSPGAPDAGDPRVVEELCRFELRALGAGPQAPSGRTH